jgi:Ca2+-transporting ATPase
MTAPAIPARTEGLTDAEAALRLTEAGPNVVAERRRLSAGSSILAQLRDPLICVLLAAAALTAVTGDLTDAAVIGLVVFVNTTVGVAQELRADRAVAALSALTAPKARVRREGAEREVAAPDIVPGDVLVLSEGDIVPADATLLEAHALLVDEAALTGESVPVGKVADVSEHAKLSAGTVVAKGRAVALVTATGASSSLGRIAALLDTGVQTTPLQRRLAQLGRTLAAVTIALCAVVLTLGLLHGEPAERMVVTAISLAVAAVPESLPAVITLSLALGARQMARRHAIVRRLPAVETLGSVTVLATDKTGTLTTGHMRAERVVTPLASYTVEDLRPDDAGPDVLELLTVASLCNDATWAAPNPEGNSSAVGDPTEIALLAAAAQTGLDRRLLQATYPRVAELPFDSTRGLMTTLHQGRARSGRPAARPRRGRRELRRRGQGNGSRACGRRFPGSRAGDRAPRCNAGPTRGRGTRPAPAGPGRRRGSSQGRGGCHHRRVPGSRHHAPSHHRRPRSNRAHDRTPRRRRA